MKEETKKIYLCLVFGIVFILSIFVICYFYFGKIFIGEIIFCYSMPTLVLGIFSILFYSEIFAFIMYISMIFKILVDIFFSDIIFASSNHDGYLTTILFLLIILLTGAVIIIKKKNREKKLIGIFLLIIFVFSCIPLFFFTSGLIYIIV